MYFNSIKVRLKRSDSVLGFVPRYNFNSIKVRLKLHDQDFRHQSLSFQFHKGTIKTDDGIQTQYYQHQFQFHKGTIKTTSSRSSQDGSIKYFNSIKVRLKLSFRK